MKNHSIVEQAVEMANNYIESSGGQTNNDLLYKRVSEWHAVNPAYTVEDLAALALCGDKYRPNWGLPSDDILRLVKAVLFNNILWE